jgi:Secretion system C-terminal sorting domain
MIYLLKKMRISVFLLLLPIYSFAIIPSDSISSPNVVTTLTNDDVCNLPGPSGLYVTGTTPTSISIAWTPVPGAFGYHVLATVIATGTVIYNGPPIGTTSTTITAPSGAPVNIVVSSICNNGESGGSSSIAAQADLIILQDLVVGFQGTPAGAFNCEDYFFDSEVHLFQAKHISNALGRFKNFKVTGQASVLGNVNVAVEYVNIDANSTVDQGQGGGGTWRFTSDKPGQPWPQNGQDVMANKTVFIKYNSATVLKLDISLTTTGGYKVCEVIQNNDYEIIKLFSNELKTDPNPTSFVQLSPNPFTDALTLYLEDPAPEHSILRIFDLHGREVLKQDIEPFVTSASVDFESTLQPGIYLARFESPEGVHMLKIVKTQ